MTTDIRMALSPDETRLLLESLAYRMMALHAIGHNPPAGCTAARKGEALAALMSLLREACEQPRTDGASQSLPLFLRSTALAKSP